MFGLIVLVLIVIGLVAGIFSLVYFYLAPNNYFFTFAKEATAKVVVIGDKVEEVLIQWRGHTLDDDWNVIPEGTVIAGKTYREPRHPLGGLRCYGFWPIKDIYIYDFRWTGVTEDGEVQHHPKETLDYILIKDDVYWCEVKEAEDSELLPLHIELLLTIGITNPYKALFRIENWLETVINRIKPSVRDYIAQSSYKDLVKEKEAMGGKLQAKLDALIKDFKDLYGIDLKKIEVKEIEPPEDYREATLKKWSAEREKERILVEASAEAERIATVYGAVEAKGKLGELVRTLEALEKSPEKGAKWIIPLPGMADILSRVFPGRATESIRPEEFKTLRETLEKLVKGIEALK
ncbi:hypothetical protein KJA15_00845 [Patescibacteria group bacterium]|nr:hypothetical protein [Patescibacteria group bacterium]